MSDSRARTGALAGHAPRWWAIGVGMRPWPRVLEALVAERADRRLFAWTPVGMAVGVVAYFAAEAEPSLAVTLTLTALALAVAVAARRSDLWGPVTVALAAVTLGFAAGAVRTVSVAAPVLPRIMIGELTGIVETLDKRANGARLVVRVVSLAAVDPLPVRVRVVLRGEVPVRAGEGVRARVRLAPPPGPTHPGGYDFARDAYFKGIGGVGSVVGKAARAPEAGLPGWGLALVAAVDRTRNDLVDRIQAAVGGQAGAISAALVTGKRDLIDDGSNDALRGAGIYHVVAISGLHMAMAAGLFFWTARALLALSPGFALTRPIKKWAALAAMAGAIAYDVLSGSKVSAERSLVMVLIVLAAVLTDRRGLSQRNLAIAALVVLLAEPETLLGPSFQMSFAAVAALIAAYEGHRGRGDGPAPRMMLGRWARGAWRALLGILVTSLVAGLATAPFAAYHFQRVTPYGLLGNVVALPVVSMIVMPSALLGTALYPLGLDGPVWWVMGLGVEGMMIAARWTAALDGSSAAVRAFGPGSLALIALALACATLPRAPVLRLAALPLLALAALGMARREAPHAYVDRAGETAAVRDGEGHLLVVGRRPSSFTLGRWLAADGDPRDTDAAVAAKAPCDALGCVARDPGLGVVVVTEAAEALEEDCRRANVLVTRLTAPPWCGAKLVLDRPRLARDGAVTLSPTLSGATRVVTARAMTSDRPWSRRPVAVPSPVTVAPAAPAPELRPTEPEDEVQ